MKSSIQFLMGHMRFAIGVCLIGFGAIPVTAQESPESTPEPAPSVTPVKRTFENAILVNNQTIETNSQNELGFLIQHRFGLIEDGSDLWGIYAPANIRMGLNYGITKDFTVGLGITKNMMQADLEWKYKILRQSKNGGSPVTLTYYGDLARSEAGSSLFKNQKNELVETNRLSFYHELMVGYKFNSEMSFQAGVNYVHKNLADSALLTHDRIGMTIMGRYKFSPQSSVYMVYNGNLVSLDKDLSPRDNPNDPLKADFSIGYEVSTGSHQFQIFVCSADGILNQDVRFSNPNDFFNKQMLIGFNITRQWGF